MTPCTIFAILGHPPQRIHTGGRSAARFERQIYDMPNARIFVIHFFRHFLRRKGAGRTLTSQSGPISAVPSSDSDNSFKHQIRKS